ncbi:MAG: DUF6165 family protein [Bacteroidota bacterium]|nr:DUF6165 family protein [Bacteroidota bacterium]
MKIEVSNGEIIDKLTIIEIKLGRIRDKVKLENLRKELEVLEKAAEKIISRKDPLYSELYSINLRLWYIEDRIRKFEKEKNFGEEFIETARAVYLTNDRRAELKRIINEQTGSNLKEEKSYEDYH